MRILTTTAVGALLTLASFTAANAGSPSFNCKRAATDTEFAICDSSYLSKLDRQMSKKYFWLMREMKKVGDWVSQRELNSTQAIWLHERDQCGDDADCIADRYLERIQALADWEFGES